MDYHISPNLRLARKLKGCESYYTSIGDNMRCADVKPTQGMVHIRTSLFEHAEQCLEAALETHTVIGSILGQAFDLHDSSCGISAHSGRRIRRG